MKALILVAALVLAGCAQKLEPVPLDPLKPRMPADVRVACDPVPPAPKRGSTMGELYTFSGNMIDLYTACALRDRAKARWVESQGM